eukprot:g14920.t2
MTLAPMEGYAAEQSSAEQSLSEKEAMNEANALKADGTSKLSAGDPEAALDRATCPSQESYGRGIALCLESKITGKLLGQLYVNRAQAHARLERHQEALEEAEAGLVEDPENGRGFWRAASSALCLERFDHAAALCMRGIKALGDSAALDTWLKEALLEEAKSALEKSREQDVAREEEVNPVAQELADRAVSLVQAYDTAQNLEDLRRAVKLFQASLEEDLSSAEER